MNFWEKKKKNNLAKVVENPNNPISVRNLIRNSPIG